MRIQWTRLLLIGGVTTAIAAPAVWAADNDSARTIDLGAVMRGEATSVTAQEPGLNVLADEGVTVRKLSQSDMSPIIKQVVDKYIGSVAAAHNTDKEKRGMQIAQMIANGDIDVYQLQKTKNDRHYTAWMVKARVTPDMLADAMAGKMKNYLPEGLQLGVLGGSLYALAGTTDNDGAWRLRPEVASVISQRLSEAWQNSDEALAAWQTMQAVKTGTNSDTTVMLRDQEPVKLMHGQQYDTFVTGTRVQVHTKGILLPYYVGAAVAAAPQTPIAYLMITPDAERDVMSPLLTKLLK